MARITSRHLFFGISITSLMLIARFSYTSGVQDQTVLSIRGLQRHDSQLFKNDWFVSNAPQPHWLFDLITFLSSELGIQSIAYLIFWLLGIAIHLTAAWIILDEFVSRYKIHFLLISTFLQIYSSDTLVGTTSDLLGEAIPHSLGGSISLFVIALITKQRIKEAYLLNLIGIAVHLQHGFVSLVLLLIISFIEFRKHRRIPALAPTAMNLILLMLVVQIRPFLGEFGDFTIVCEVLIPAHCDANSWPTTWILRLLAAVAIYFVFLQTRANPPQNLKIVLNSIFLCLTLSLLFDILNLPFLDPLVKATNLYRFGVPIISIVPLIAVIIAQDFFTSLSSRGPRIGIRSYIKLFLSIESVVLFFLIHDVSLVYTLIFGLFVFLLFATVTVIRISSQRIFFVASLILIFFSAMTIHLPFTWSHLRASNFEFGSKYHRLDKILRTVPEGQTIMVNPIGGQYLRISTQRAIFVDCKYKPYGGAALNEYLTRMSLFGGYSEACLNNAFSKLELKDIVSIARSVKINYIVIDRIPYVGYFPGWKYLVDGNHVLLYKNSST